MSSGEPWCNPDSRWRGFSPASGESGSRPGRLVLGWCGTRAIHVVVDENRADDELIVITAYEPQPDLWELGLKRSKQ